MDTYSTYPIDRSATSQIVDDARPQSPVKTNAGNLRSCGCITQYLVTLTIKINKDRTNVRSVRELTAWWVVCSRSSLIFNFTALRHDSGVALLAA